MRFWLLPLLAACAAELPELPLEGFACSADEVDADGALPCPSSHWCRDQQCTPRLGCTPPGAVRPACEPDTARCGFAFNAETTAVACELGRIHTGTTSVPIPQEDCGCADGHVCVAYVDGLSPAAEAFPIFALPSARAPLAMERLGARVCARACSSELDCPAAHTCRAASAMQAGLQTPRHTIGVCYPDRLAIPTSTAPRYPARPEQPDPAACAEELDCDNPGGRNRVCQVRALVVPDHPLHPAGAAWGARVALVPRCVDDPGGLVPVDMGCTKDSDRCESGICHEGRCVLLCDPKTADPCPGGRACREVLVERARPDGAPSVKDLVFLCPYG